MFKCFRDNYVTAQNFNTKIMSGTSATSTDNGSDLAPNFSSQWIRSFIDGYFERRGKDPQKIDIVELKVQKNAIQGILSTAYLVDILYKDSNPPLGIKRKIKFIYFFV